MSQPSIRRRNQQERGSSNLLQPPRFVEEPSAVIALRKSTVQINCSTIATPVARTIWLKDGARIKPDDRHVVLTSGALRIQSVQGRRKGFGNDEGVYQCLASNRAGTVASRKVTLHIAVLSRKFEEQPQSINAWEGTTARFSCKVKKAYPAPSISWEHNGQVIVPSKRHVVLPNGALQIHNVQQVDQGTYQCVASNIARIRRSNTATLTVQQAKSSKQPNFTTIPSNTSVISGEEAVLECIATGVPVPTVQWKKVGGADRAYDYSLAKPGGCNLRIRSASPKDGGEYMCIVSASGRSMTHSTFLSVQEPPHFINTPKLPKGLLDIGATLTLQCSATGVPPPRITWLKNGKELVGNQRQSGINNDLVIQSLSTKDSGVYQCFAENDIGSVQTSTRVLVRRSVNTYPPLNVTGVGISSEEVNISWLPPRGPEQVLAYSINYQPADKSSKELQVVLAKDFTSEVIRSLSGFTKYTFYVTPFFTKGQGLNSEVITVQTLPGKPSTSPGNIVLNSLTPDSIDVSWDPPPKRYRNGILTSYIIKYHNKSISETILLPSSMQKKTISGLASGEVYMVQVAAATKMGWGPFSKEERLRVTTQQKDMISSPKITIKGLNSTALKVTWTPPLYGASKVQEYRLYYAQEHSHGVIQNPQVIDKGTSSYIITNLLPNTKYIVRFMAWDGSKTGQPAVEVGQTRLGESQVSSVGITNVVCHPRDPFTIEVMWQKSFSKDPAFYTISYGVAGNLNKEKRKTKIVVETHVKIKDLSPGRKYHVMVKPLDANYLAMSDWVHSSSSCQTPEQRPGSPPRNFKFAIMSKVSVDLQWEPPEKPNGKVSKYMIAYTTDPSLPDKEWEEQEEVLSKFISRFERVVTARLTGLTPNATFYIKVKAGNQQGYGPYSNILKVLMVLPKNRDDAPKLSYKYISSTSVDVSWESPKSYKGKADSYEMIYTTNQLASERKWQKRLLSLSPDSKELVVRLTGLTSNKTYYVKVRADYNSQYGPWSKVLTISLYEKNNGSLIGPEKSTANETSPNPKASEEKEDFQVKLGIIIGCVISAFCIVMLVLFIIWRCPCRLKGQKKRNQMSLVNTKAANGYTVPPRNSSHQTMSTNSTGQSGSTYDEGSAGSSISNTCQCRCTCSARKWPTINSMPNKPPNQVAGNGHIITGSGQLVMTQTTQEFRKASLQNHNKDTETNGHISNGYVLNGYIPNQQLQNGHVSKDVLVPLQVLSDGKNTRLTVPEQQRPPTSGSISVDV
ncbi:protogenin isoform X2 [Nematostella vectensis]|uniref:protogenin isoform X2 n=1 Tax=Nematostella vectensis TaxID=45351 RepID=UPI00138FF261|nr:protogenin isoform X2 [Nematostella vectensis]